MNIQEHNRKAWNKESFEGGEWSIPVNDDIIDAARKGNWNVILTPLKHVPKSWFGEFEGKRVLCLASGGGQQVPTLAAAGASVTSFDLSDVQLEKDRIVAERHGLDVQCIRGDMTDLSRFEDESFDLIFHPVSNLFVPNVEVVWQECYRVLKPKGDLLAGFMNPTFFLFNHDEALEDNILTVKYKQPYREPDSLDVKDRGRIKQKGEALEFGHSLDTQIGGQLKAGFLITGFYEDYWSDEATLLNRYSPTSIATRATKMDKQNGIFDQ